MLFCLILQLVLGVIFLFVKHFVLRRVFYAIPFCLNVPQSKSFSILACRMLTFLPRNVFIIFDVKFSQYFVLLNIFLNQSFNAFFVCLGFMVSRSCPITKRLSILPEEWRCARLSRQRCFTCTTVLRFIHPCQSFLSW